MRLSTHWGSSYGFLGRAGGFRSVGLADAEDLATADLVETVGAVLDDVARMLNRAADLGVDSETLAAWRAQHATLSDLLGDAAARLGTSATEAEVGQIHAEAEELRQFIEQAVPQFARSRLASMALWTGLGVFGVIGAVLGVAYFAKKQKKRRRRRSRRARRRRAR